MLASFSGELWASSGDLWRVPVLINSLSGDFLRFLVGTGLKITLRKHYVLLRTSVKNQIGELQRSAPGELRRFVASSGGHRRLVWRVPAISGEFRPQDNTLET